MGFPAARQLGGTSVYQGICAYNRIITDGNSLQNGAVAANPHPVPDSDRAGQFILRPVGIADMMEIRIHDSCVPGNGTIASYFYFIGTIHYGRCCDIGIVSDGKPGLAACNNPHSRAQLDPALHMEYRIRIHMNGGFCLNHIPDVFSAQVEPFIYDQPGTLPPGNRTAEIGNDLESVKVPDGMEQIHKL